MSACSGNRVVQSPWLRCLLCVAALAVLGACRDKTGRAPAKEQPARASAAAVSSPDRVTPDELAAYLDWRVEVEALVGAAMEEARAHLDETAEEMRARAERNAERGRPVMAREPFAGTRKGRAMQEVFGAFYASGDFFRDEKQLARLRESNGRELIDSIAEQEALFRMKVGGARERMPGASAGAGRIDMATPAPADFVEGTAAVRLRMTEDEVSRALGSEPVQRQETDRLVDAAWAIGGAVPGRAVARFVGGPLVRIEFARIRLDDPPLPRVSGDAARTVTQGLAFKAVQHIAHAENPALELREVVAAAGAPGQRIRWRLAQGGGTPGSHLQPVVTNTWAWVVEPGGRLLLVDETDGIADQPIVRDLPRQE